MRACAYAETYCHLLQSILFIGWKGKLQRAYYPKRVTFIYTRTPGYIADQNNTNIGTCRITTELSGSVSLEIHADPFYSEADVFSAECTAQAMSTGYL